MVSTSGTRNRRVAGTSSVRCSPAARWTVRSRSLGQERPRAALRGTGKAVTQNMGERAVPCLRPELGVYHGPGAAKGRKGPFAAHYGQPEHHPWRCRLLAILTTASPAGALQPLYEDRRIVLFRAIPGMSSDSVPCRGDSMYRRNESRMEARTDRNLRARRRRPMAPSAAVKTPALRYDRTGMEAAHRNGGTGVGTILGTERLSPLP